MTVARRAVLGYSGAMIFSSTPRIVRHWLALCLILVAAMVLIGGLTRLTESGLSIVEWKLVSGIFPPLSEQAWQAEFDAYKATPQFEQVNRNFSLGDFQRIFWLEYLHRVLGRIIGLVLIVPFLLFSARRMLSKPQMRRMFVACLLVAAQGAVGWIMVASGLKDLPRVEPVKLALHLLLAFALFGWLLWTYWQTTLSRPPLAVPKLGLYARLLFLALLVQIGFGALVAGLDAGYSYNSFPLMDGQLVPQGLHLLQPWWRNHIESIVTVQFQHRALGVALALGVFLFVAYAGARVGDTARKALHGLLSAVVLQFALGVATLLSGMNIALASGHQLVALLLFGVMLRVIYLTPVHR